MSQTSEASTPSPPADATETVGNGAAGRAPAHSGAEVHARPVTRDAWIWALAAWGLLRLVASGAAAASVTWLSQGPTVTVPGYAPPHLTGLPGLLAGAWLRADALWYLKVAVHGYGRDLGSFAFLPGFPLLVRVVRPLVGGNELFAGLLVANAACLIGLFWLFRLVEELLGKRAARACVVGLALFPTAFFLVAPYGEPVLLAAGAGALLAQARGRPVLATAAGVLAALARPFGALIALPLAGLACIRPGSRTRWIAPLGPLAGSAAWMAYVGYKVGDPLGALRVQAVWQRTLNLPWATVWGGLQTWITWRKDAYGPYFLADLLAALFGLALIAGVAIALRRGKASWWVVAGLGAYGGAALLAPLSTPFLPRPLMSVPRFILALFPLFMGYALIPARWRIPLAAISAAGLAVTTAVYVAARPIF